MHPGHIPLNAMGEQAQNQGTITMQTLRRVADTARADMGTVSRYLAGVRVRPLARSRIEDALRELGMQERVRAET